MKTKRLLVMLLAIMACSIQAWSYRFTDNYTIEVKFKINDVSAGIIFANYNGFDGDFYMWQFNVGYDGKESKFRPHQWNPATLLEEKSTGSVTLNTTDWFETKIVISDNGTIANTYLRKAGDGDYVLIDANRSGTFRYGMVGFRQDHGESGVDKKNESASYDYIKVTANDGGKVLYYEDFSGAVSWENNPTVAGGVLTATGIDYSERLYRPNNMFKDAIDMHYAVEADVTIEEGYVSFVFGLADSGTNYMWQISPNYYNDGSANTYYHLDNGNESWKVHAAGPRYPNFNAAAFIDTKRHVKIEVVGNVVYTYIDNQLQDTFVQCDMTDLALLNSGKIGIRADGRNGKTHTAYIDNVKLTEYDTDGYATVVLYEPFTDGTAHRFNIDGVSGASIEPVSGDYALKINTSGSIKVRLIQTDCTGGHSYQANGLCQYCGGYQAPGNDGGTYTIGNMGQLMAFAEIVNSSNQSAVGSLTADIDMENYHRFTPIGLNNDGSWKKPFSGTFYGNNHVVRNLYVKTECEGGLFSRTRGGKIYNLGLENAHIESTANLRCGAMAGEHHDNAIMENCYARGTIKFVTTHSQTNAMAGECAGGHFVNCYTTLPKLTCAFPASFGGSATNSYEGVNASDDSTIGGELCYLLNESSCYDATWRQNIGTDTYPELDPTHGIVNKISSAGYTTQYIPSTDVTIPTGVKAYAGETSGTKLSLKELTGAISKDDAVILQGSEGFYSFMPTTGVSRAASNDLKGSDGNVTSDGSTFYALSNKANGVGFYPVGSDVTIPAGKAYLYTGSSPVKGFTFVFDDDATAVEMVNGQSSMVNGPIYNLAGQRIQKMQKGINIIGGKKMVFGK